MDLGLKGKVFVVTGASRGLGLATATVLVAEGARVVLCARDPEGVRASADRRRDRRSGSPTSSGVAVDQRQGPRRRADELGPQTVRVRLDPRTVTRALT